MVPHFQFVIQGGGIGGLCLAIALRKQGRSVRVLERTPAASPAGAGILMAPNAMQVLRGLGLDDAVIARGWPIHSVRLQGAGGKQLQQTQLAGLEKEFGYPTYALHRSWLHEILLSALPEDTVQFGSSLVSFVEVEDRVEMVTAREEKISADFLIGADGLRSEIRSKIFPGTRLRPTGMSSFRGIARIAGTQGNNHESCEIWEGRTRLGFSHISASEIYWYMTFDDSFNTRVKAEGAVEIASRFFQKHFPSHETLLQQTPPRGLIHTDILDLETGKPWQKSRVGLIGDAAHATTPNLGQGAAQAMEDAWFLAVEIASEPDVVKAFSNFESKRRWKAEMIVRNSRLMGELSRISNRPGVFLRDWLLRLVPESSSMEQLRKIYSLEQ